jgi:hypothetical protein
MMRRHIQQIGSEVEYTYAKGDNMGIINKIRARVVAK